MISSKIAVIVPTYNEALNIGILIDRITAVGERYDVIVVDDGSPDGTAEVVRAAAERHPGRVSLIERANKNGRGGAVLAGIVAAVRNPQYDPFVEMDADQSHQPEELPSLVAATGANTVAVGSRYAAGGRIDGWSGKRKVWSGMSNGLLRNALRLGLSDYTNGYRAYPRAAAELLLRAEMRERGYIALSEWAGVLHRAGFRFADVPTHFINRVLGESNMGAGEALAAMKALPRLVWRSRFARSN